jgi:hypothetical protein
MVEVAELAADTLRAWALAEELKQRVMACVRRQRQRSDLRLEGAGALAVGTRTFGARSVGHDCPRADRPPPIPPPASKRCNQNEVHPGPDPTAQEQTVRNKKEARPSWGGPL